MSFNQDNQLYFAEEFSPLLRNVRGEIIALSPKVCYRLDKENIAYRTYEDFYCMFQRKEYAQDYHRRLSSWVDSFDDYLRDKLIDSLDKKINFVRLYGYYITTMLGSFIVSGRNILAVFEKLKPKKVYLITCGSPQPGFFGWRFFSEKGDTSSYLLPLFCKERNIAYRVIKIDSEGRMAQFEFKQLKKILSGKFKGAIRIGQSLYLRIIYPLFFFKRCRLKAQGKLKTFLLLRRDWLSDFCEKAIKSGHRLFSHKFEGPQAIFENPGQEEVKDFTFDSNRQILWEKIGVDCIREFSPSQWASSQAGLDLSSVLDERFLYFLQKICPIISLSAKRYEIIFEKEKIDYVISAYKIIPSDFGLMQAAALDSRVSAVQIEHGGGEMENLLWHFSEQPANIYVSASEEEAVFFDKFFNNGGLGKTKVVAGKVWTGKYEKEAQRLLPKFAKAIQGNGLNKHPVRVYYLPSGISVQRLGSTYPLCWYYLLQKSLCEYFTKFPQYHFVIKVLPVIRWYSQSLLKFVRDLGAGNISYEEGDLVTNLRRADRVITDYLSTPTFEARLMGLPVLSLYHESISVRHTAKESYGKTLVSFRKSQDMFAHIDKFLSSDSKEYIISMKDNFSAPTLLETLEQLKYEKKETSRWI